MESPSAPVCAFIHAYIESIDLLRVLLLLARHPEREWTADEICAATALSRASVVLQLQRLSVYGLTADAAGTESTSRYKPRAPELDQMVSELIQLDEQKPVTLIQMIYARQSSSAQAFADAFRLRRN